VGLWRSRPRAESGCRGLPVTRLDLIRAGRGASGAVAAQLAQALTSFVLHLAASRQLGPSGLGIFALLYSGIVLATAISTGLVGDSLTVLDRTEPRIRSGLQVLGVGMAAGFGLVGALVVWMTSVLETVPALLFGAVIASFLLEDLLRRSLMASLKFWSVVVTDATALAVSVGWLTTIHLLSVRFTLNDLLLALLLGQCAGMIAAARLLPQQERRWAAWRDPDLRSVVRFGAWRASQQATRPATLLAVRSIVVAALGAATFGQLEAARIYVAPALLLVQGLAGFFFSTFASDTRQGRSELLRRADIGALASFGMVVLFGVIALAMLPVAGGIVTAGSFELERVAVGGWLAYAGCTALLSAYGGLAAVTGAHVRVFAVRLVGTGGALPRGASQRHHHPPVDPRSGCGTRRQGSAGPLSRTACQSDG
jgi:O-antigen/teichoic acid export membrane protein